MTPAQAPLGVLLLDTVFPRIPGDVGNAKSYDYPVLLKTVSGATVQRVVYDQDPILLDRFITAAQELESQGAAAITSSCGFLSLFQKKVAQAVSIPVFLSSLLQVPVAHTITSRRVAIITANSNQLTQEVLGAAGIEAHIPTVVIGLQDAAAFSDPILKDGTTLDKEAIQAEILERTSRVLSQYSDVGAFVFECHNLSPYSRQVQQATSRPVFDIIDFANWVYSTLHKRDYAPLSVNR